MSVDLLHHYTNINTLALILKNRTIRFNRLDHVDDVTECEAFSKIKLGEFLFVSCWTYDLNESLPQWNMYTPDMAGVRITLPSKMFDYKPLTPPRALNLTMVGNVYSPIPFERMFTTSYMVLPVFQNEKAFGRFVQYDPDFEAKKNQAIEFEILENEAAKFHADLLEVASLKSPDWEFQKEYRYILCIVPSPDIPMDINYFIKLSKHLPNHMVNSLYNGTGPDIDYFDIDIREEVINNLSVITGPLCDDGDFICVESLVKRYTSNGKVDKSRFTGTIRK